MEVDPHLSSLLQTLKLDPPCIPSKTWESIPSESGPAAQSIADPQPPDLSTVSESLLVRLLLNALHGVKSSLLEIKNLSAAFCSTPADRTSFSVPNLWCRSSSTNALGKMLRSVAGSGILVFFIRCFVSHYTHIDGKGPPYSLVNQAFAVAVGKVLEGYFCAFDTLLASAKLRRMWKGGDEMGGVHGEITILEVYLHTKELRTNIEALASICFPGGVSSDGEDLSVDAELGFDSFPRGVDLLTHLYVLLRDADPVHCALLKFLFVRTCEPYCAFIKSWIYYARIDDPFEEFFIVNSDNSPTSKCAAGFVDGFSLAYIKEQDCIQVPCFLEDFCRPLLRAGQQLQVLVRLLNLCNSSVIGAHVPCSFANLVDILPLWPGMSSDSVFLLNSISFGRNDIETMMHEREAMYQSLLEKLQSFFMMLNVGYQRMNQNAITIGTVQSMASSRKGVNTPFSLVYDEYLILSPSGNQLRTTRLDAGHQDVDASSTSNESLYEVDPSKSSDFSSTYSSEEEVEPQGVLELHDTRDTHESILQSFSGAKRLFSCSSTGKTVGHAAPLANQCHENANLNEISPHHSKDTECVRMPKTLDRACQSFKCWPLGGLLKNPFYAHVNTEAMEGEESYFHETLVPFDCELDPVRRIPIMNGIHKSLSSCIDQPSNYHDYYDLSMNPMLDRPAWLRTVHNSRDRSSMNNVGFFFPYFDFSSVADPCKAYSENTVYGPDYGSQVGTDKPLETAASDAEMNETSSDCVRDNMDPQLVLSSRSSLRNAKPLSGEVSSGASGGANWEGLLKYSGEDATLTERDTWHDLGGMFEIPLDIIINKCIVQEILLQYKYVSTFTIKLLEEGFVLCEHLLALRRYHFMELADWADSFIMSLCNKKWLVIEPELKIAEIQGLLDLALQRSSCESDHYKERLFVLKKEDSMMHQSTSSTGVHAFDFIMLGYKVDWPVSIIVSQDALTIYADIFSYLIQVRLAVFSLSDAWRSLKAIMHSTYHGQHLRSSKLNDFNILVKIRQQINHFVSTLQQFVHSQLSDVSWCRFQHSLKHQVKDMLDLESIHTRYLADALHICFLSSETKAIATIITNILQCALDFRSCLINGSRFDLESDGVSALNLRSQINFSQVFAVRTAFEKNLKDLYLLYLRSPKHRESSICRFWSYLNYNDYYSVIIRKETAHFYLQV